MGNCPTTPSKFATKNLDPLCRGERMWTTFLFSSLFTLFGGWFIILIYDVVKALVIRKRRLELLSTIRTLSHVDEVNLFKKRKSNQFYSCPYNFCSFQQEDRVYYGHQLIN